MYQAMVSKKKKHKSLPSPPFTSTAAREDAGRDLRVALHALLASHVRTSLTTAITSLCIHGRERRRKLRLHVLLVITSNSPHLHANPIKHSNKYYEAYCTDREDGRRDKPSAKHDQISSACNLSMGYHCYMLFVIPDVCCSILGLYSVERLRYSLVERFSPHRPCRAPV